MPVGARIRANNVFGTTTDNPLTAAAVSFNSSELPLLPEVSGDHAVITLDPLRTNGEPEIVVVTAHGPGANSATITRGQYNTVARQHPQGTIWAHAPLDEDMIEVTTFSLRPADPYEGQIIYETDTDRYIARQNGAWVGLIPVGLISPYGGSLAPVGWLLCDGMSYPTATYPDLFALIGYDFGGAGPNFNVPNLQDRVPVGLGATFPTIGATGGSATSTATHTHTLNNHVHSMSSHTHLLNNHNHSLNSHVHSLNSHVHDTNTTNSAHSHAAAANQFVITHNANPFWVSNAGNQQVTFTLSTANDGSHAHGNTDGPNTPNTGTSSGNTGNNNSASAGPSTPNTGTNNDASGGSSVGAANGNMPPFQVVGSYIIKY